MKKVAKSVDRIGVGKEDARHREVLTANDAEGRKRIQRKTAKAQRGGAATRED